MVPTRINSLLLICLIPILISCASAARRPPQMPAIPEFLQRKNPSVVTEDRLSRYPVRLAAAQDSYAIGDIPLALERLERTETYRASLLSDARADAAAVNTRIVNACWQLSMPTCVIENLAGLDRNDARSVADDIRDVLEASEFNAPRYERKLPAVSRDDLRHFELFTEADRLAQAKKWRRSLQLLVDLRASIGRIIDRLDSEEKYLQLARADANLMLRRYEAAIELYQQWTLPIRRGSDDSARREGEVGQRVQTSIATARAALGLQHHAQAVADLRAERWKEALANFARSGRYISLPENSLGSGIAYLKLDNGGSPLFALGPLPIESALSTYEGYVKRYPEADNHADIQRVVDVLRQEIARRSDPREIERAIGMAMAAPVMNVVNDLQRWSHDLIEARRPELFASMRTYIEFGNGAPLRAVVNGLPVPPLPSGDRAPAGGLSRDSVARVFADLSLAGIPPIPVMPSWSQQAQPAPMPLGAGGNVQPPSRQPPQPLPALPPLEEFRAMNAGRTIDPRALKEGDVIVSRAHTPISNLIQIATRSDVSHVMLYVGHGHVIEAVREGVQLTSLKDALQENSYAMVMRNTRLKDAAPAIAYAYSKLGLAYDTWGVIAHPRFGTIQITEGTPGASRVTRDYFCSDLVGEAFIAAGTPLFIPPSGSLPGDFRSFGFLDGIGYAGHLKSEPPPPWLPVVEGLFDFLDISPPNRQ